ncbi:hypothetical protein FAUST_8392 [Fusarium austroamericanum]|uniref:Uncharacterized protein n=1 Tax=Fusarium austroamericanum TaxID=282268 RepID=A0AAN5Z5Z2_FUSAU|nr:hypothetical protein FAUST_8392 [Fusarium austroamericanum]
MREVQPYTTSISTPQDSRAKSTCIYSDECLLLVMAAETSMQSMAEEQIAYENDKYPASTHRHGGTIERRTVDTTWKVPGMTTPATIAQCAFIYDLGRRLNDTNMQGIYNADDVDLARSPLEILSLSPTRRQCRMLVPISNITPLPRSFVLPMSGMNPGAWRPFIYYAPVLKSSRTLGCGKTFLALTLQVGDGSSYQATIPSFTHNRFSMSRDVLVLLGTEGINGLQLWIKALTSLPRIARYPKTTVQDPFTLTTASNMLTHDERIQQHN